ncbi:MULTISPECIES: DUF3881 family protein [unclassified Butyrivibrio]|uniref:DUF3881 family protein n=1 Tax=unclassified Butyrivibrio TaxID=2639466 RepID=UPI0003B322E0|nr:MULTISPECIES: DUF3881 family protein [unclassified Butyrivibrio]MBE5839074.1 DUF3881 family protein [Butyrivibrio sp.]SEG36633.1 protein of unknown function [Butyrivibrio sp. Su6]
MHKFLRAVGFSKIKDRKELTKLITDSIQNAGKRSYVTTGDNIILAEFARDFADGIGFAVCGEFDEDDKFIYEYYYPYLVPTGISTEEDINVERHAAQYSYAGVCNEPRIGVTLIFYLQNMIPYVKYENEDHFPIRGTTLSLSALSIKGQILMPIAKTEEEKEVAKKKNNYRNKLINNARRGDETAIESLTLDDMDLYTTLSKKIRKQDVYSLVDSYFMPYGVECDHYSVLGEIKETRTVENSMTKEKIHIMRVNCNDLEFDVCINDEDLLGEPAVGRRFKGNIWMQGYINFPDAN